MLQKQHCLGLYNILIYFTETIYKAIEKVLDEIREQLGREDLNKPYDYQMYLCLSSPEIDGGT